MATTAASPPHDGTTEEAATDEGGEEVQEQPLPSWGTFDYGAGLREVAIIKAIEEYFAYHHLDGPLAAFQRDVERVGLKHAPSRACSGIIRDIEEALNCLGAGSEEDFWGHWGHIMPQEFRTGREGRSLELRLRAHFATYRARKVLEAGKEPDAAEQQKDLEPFRAFLSERGSDEVCGDEALMPLFALPFMQRPHAQPTVKEVFAKEWLHSLSRDVEAALRSRQPQVPLLYNLLEPASPGSAGNGAAWQAVWAELLRIADAGLDAATLKADGAPAPGELLAAGRRQLGLLREQVPGGLDLRLTSQVYPGVPTSPTRGVRSRAATARPQLPRDLDFGRLAQFICASAQERQAMGGGGPTPTLAAVLRALLQRLASAESPLGRRRGVLVSVVCFDVLGVRSRPEALPALLSDPAVAELTLGILAVLACEAIGRTYVVANLACVEKMAQLLKEQPLDSALHTQALAAMQRLSLRRTLQDRIIELGIVEWVVGVLGWQGEAIHGAPSEFSLEFGSALLMNLALRTAGKRKCADLDVLSVAFSLVEHWNPQIRTHINGTLYSLLALPSFRASARRAGLEGVLRALYGQSKRAGDDISARQVEYLLDKLDPEAEDEREADPGAESGEDDEDDDENFLEEEELAGLLLGDRSGHSAEEDLRGFLATPAVAEAQGREFRAFLA